MIGQTMGADAHRALLALTETLVCEYVGAVPAPRVARAVSSAGRTMLRRGLRGELLYALAEQAARRELINLIAGGARGSRGRAATPHR